MPRLTKKVPSYRLHKASRQAVVTLNGNDIYLGPYASPESKAEYERLVAEWLGARREEYRAAFAALGYQLIHHDQGFFYFTGESTLRSQRLRAVTLFLLILFQDLEDRKFTHPERSWERTLLDRRFVIHDLPHFGTAQRRVMMDAVEWSPA